MKTIRQLHLEEQSEAARLDAMKRLSAHYVSQLNAIDRQHRLRMARLNAISIALQVLVVMVALALMLWSIWL